MRALTIRAGAADSEGAEVSLDELAEPTPGPGDLLVDGVAIGVCGTDRWLLSRSPRTFPGGRDRMIIGHESLGRVRQAPAGSPFSAGDFVAGLVRRPDPVPCKCCAAGELDICQNGTYTERGVVGADGYGAEVYLLDQDYAVRVSPQLGLTGVLVEPTSIVAKAWEVLDLSVRWPDGRALILGAGPIGLLAALLGQQRGYEVHVVDQVADGPKVAQVKALGATYHQGADGLDGSFEAVVECSGELVRDAINATARGGALCFVAGGHRAVGNTIELAALSGGLVGNRTYTGVVSSNHRHFEAAHTALLGADRSWLEDMLTRVVPVQEYPTAFAGGPDVIKTVIQLADHPGA
jgi:threonine dehydrogenase-like Zn-dependent dehydrogenase